MATAKQKRSAKEKNKNGCKWDNGSGPYEVGN